MRFILLLPVVAIVLSQGAEAGPIRVGLFDDAGCSGPGVPRVTEQLSAAGGIRLTKLKGADFAAGRLKDFDVVIFTGGSASQQAKTLGDQGREEIRRFVREGGGYIGICAGAYLACSGFDWGLGLLDARTVSPRWQRGVGTVQIEFTEQGCKTTPLVVKRGSIFYENGPIIQPDGRSDIEDYEVLAWFRTELAENDSPSGVMVNSPAITRGPFGKGRVLISSPHPEQSAGMERFMENAVRWAAGLPPSIPQDSARQEQR